MPDRKNSDSASKSNLSNNDAYYDNNDQPSVHELGVSWAKMKEHAKSIFGDRIKRKEAEDALILSEIEIAHDEDAAWAFVSSIADFNDFAARYLRFKSCGFHETLLGAQDMADAIISIKEMSLLSKMKDLLELDLTDSDLANLIYQRRPKSYDADDPVLGVSYVFSVYGRYKAR